MIKDAITKGRWEGSARFKRTHRPENQSAVTSVPGDQSRELHQTARCHMQQINAFQC